MRTKISRRDWNILHGCLTVAKLYVVTLFICWLLIYHLPVMPILATATIVIALLYVIEWLLRPLGRAIRNSYEIEDEHEDCQRTVIPDPSLRCNQSVILKQEDKFNPVEGTPA